MNEKINRFKNILTKKVNITLSRKKAKMSQPTNIQVFTESVSGFVSSVILEPIVDYLKDKTKEEITKDKLIEVLKLPAPTTVARTPQRTSQSLTSSASRTRRTSKVNTNQAKCEWVFTKGASVGQRCDNPAMENSKFCSSCKDKKGAGGQGRKPGGNTEKAGSKAKPGLTTKVEKQEEEDPMSVVGYGKTKDGIDLVWDQDSKFIMKVIDDANGVYSVVGVHDTEKDTMRPLTKTDKERIKKIFGSSMDYEDGVVFGSRS